MYNTSYVDYSIHNVILKNKKDGKNKILEKLLWEQKNCFSSLDGDYLDDSYDSDLEARKSVRSNIYKSFNSDGFVTFHCKTNVDKKIIKWYSVKINEFGLTHEIIEFNKEVVKFKVPWLDNRLKMLTTLCSLRYLQEEPFPLIVEFYYKAAAKFKKLDVLKSFDLFSLSHNNPQISKNYDLNTNHSLVTSFPGGGYGDNNYYKFISLEDFKKNFCKKEGYLNETLQGVKKLDCPGGQIKKLFKDFEVGKLIELFK
jgi:hypothetical protein